MRRPFDGSYLITGDTATHAEYGVGPANDYALPRGARVVAPFSGLVEQYRSPEGGYSLQLTNGDWVFKCQHLGIDRASGWVGEGADLAEISNSGSLWDGYHLHAYSVLAGQRMELEEFYARLGFIPGRRGQVVGGLVDASAAGTPTTTIEEDAMRLIYLYIKGDSGAKGVIGSVNRAFRNPVERQRMFDVWGSPGNPKNGAIVSSVETDAAGIRDLIRIHTNAE